ncbi:helix-turn-helix domain-containing protein [Catellatospora sp. NPDC049133]|uniref:helix-turn-helix domain-containing protein n=1 Tax=Catellatospora sp. NPDC049133 TaxID=3155499 RepID=UPI0033CC3DEC
MPRRHARARTVLYRTALCIHGAEILAQRGPEAVSAPLPVALRPKQTERGVVTFTKPFISTEELAAVLQVDPSTVRRWRTAQPLQGPPFINLSERVTVYSTEDVQHWLTARRVVPGAAK